MRSLISEALGSLTGVDVLVFEPGGGPADVRINRSTRAPSMTPGRAALVGLMDRYRSALLDPSITLLEVHKLMYFLQAAGEPLRLDYVKGHYGPYAENLRHVLRTVEGHYITGYADGGDAPDKQLAIVPGAVPDAEALLTGACDTTERFDRVVKLLEGFETPFGLELLATLHWVATVEEARTPAAIVERTHAWGERKAQFSSQHIQVGLERLQQDGWLPPSDQAMV